MLSAISGTSRSIRSGLHAEETGQTREETTCKECEPYPTVLEVKQRHYEEQYGEDDEHDADNLVLLFQIGHSALTDVSSDFAHCRSTFIFFQHSAIEEKCKTQCNDGSAKYDPYILN